MNKKIVPPTPIAIARCKQIIEGISLYLPRHYAERAQAMLAERGIVRSLDQIRNTRLGRNRDLTTALVLQEIAAEYGYDDTIDLEKADGRLG